MKLANLEITGDLVLAPMAGVTDLAFRTICAELGAAVTVTEMVSSRALIYQDKKSRSLLHKTPLGVCGAQIFGNDPSVMADGAALALEASGADFIDINMGCPMPKIANNGDGSALMKDPEKAARIVEAVVKAVPVPVTVKMRKGWDKSSCNAPELAAMLEQAGDRRPRQDEDHALFRRCRLGLHPHGQGGREDPRDRQRRYFYGGGRGEV